jgi:hypothetical protein
MKVSGTLVFQNSNDALVAIDRLHDAGFEAKTFLEVFDQFSDAVFGGVWFEAKDDAEVLEIAHRIKKDLLGAWDQLDDVGEGEPWCIAEWPPKPMEPAMFGELDGGAGKASCARC